MMKKWLKRTIIGLFLSIVLIIAIIHVGMSTMRFSDQDAQDYFLEQGFEGEIETLDINGHSIKVVSDLPQESDSVLLLFVHGAPGSWDAFKTYLTDKEIYTNARVVVYDRPGYGGSDPRAMPSIIEQSNIVKELLRQYGQQRNILIGHSYGGPIAGHAGLDTRSNVDEVVMIAPLLDPENEPLHWYSYFSFWKATSWLLPNDLVVAGAEKFAHADELEKIKDSWSDAACNFVHVHGLEDGLAPGQENVDFAKKHIRKDRLKTITYDDKGHLIIWSEYDLMKDIILDVM